MGYYSFSDLAIEEIEEICEFLAQTHPRFASQWFDEVREKCKLVSSFPSMSKSYAWLDPDLRGFVIDDYIIFYYPAENVIKIIRVIHGRWCSESVETSLNKTPKFKAIDK